MGAGDTIEDAVVLDVPTAAGDLHAAILHEVRSALDDEDAASRLRGRMDEMETRLRRIERQAEGRRELALKAMAEAGLERLEAPGLRIEVRRVPPPLVVIDESLILDALKNGTAVPGATFTNSKVSLAVRTK